MIKTSLDLWLWLQEKAERLTVSCSNGGTEVVSIPGKNE